MCLWDSRNLATSVSLDLIVDLLRWMMAVPGKLPVAVLFANSRTLVTLPRAFASDPDPSLFLPSLLSCSGFYLTKHPDKKTPNQMCLLRMAKRELKVRRMNKITPKKYRKYLLLVLVLHGLCGRGVQLVRFLSFAPHSPLHTWTSGFVSLECNSMPAPNVRSPGEDFPGLPGAQGSFSSSGPGFFSPYD